MNQFQFPLEIIKKILSFEGTYILFKKTLWNVENLLSIPKKIHDINGYSYIFFSSNYKLFHNGEINKSFKKILFKKISIKKI